MGADASDTILGSNGTDTLQVSGNYTPAADANLEDVENLVVTGNASAVTVNLSNQAGETFNLTASNQGDTITTADGADTISGGSGNDVIDGGSGNDTLNADAGADSITGGAGADSIAAGEGNDTIVGADASDTILGLSLIHI